MENQYTSLPAQSLPSLSLRFRFSLLGSLFFLLFSWNASAQTIISPSGSGGFNSGSTFASNGWSTYTSLGAVNVWSCGGDGQPASFGNRSAFISRNGGIDWEYNGTPAFKNVSHLYRLVTFPAGVNGFTLEFDFEVDGETSFDYLLVSLAPEGLTGLDPVETNYDNINDTGT
ncbi:MAG: hypothetical protein R2792_20545, partial [Saprospiraceae bacterium]